jgi:GntR family transcriptional regulator
VGPPLSALEGVGGGLEVDAEGIATPAAHWQPYSLMVLLYSSIKLRYSYPSHLCRSGVATVLLVSDLEATGGRDADLTYMRVAGDIAARIASGELRPGARLRAERDLAEYYEVSYGTVRRAMQVLRERALITTIHGRGTFVSGSGNSN